MPRPDRDADELSTVLRPKVPESAVTSPTYVLVVVEGPNLGATTAIDASKPTRLLVGTSPACDLQLSDRHASRRHAALDVSEHGLRLTDLGSTNGTFANGLRVTDAFLRAGDEIVLGASHVRIDLASEQRKIPLSSAMRFGQVVGASLGMRRLYPLCERIAASDVPVVVEGETGTGKELMAEALHAASPRSSGPFVVFDCTAVPPNLVESALFGHERGAFTGAVAARRGVFEQAQGGTLFIDEIGDLDISLQPKLLRALERGDVQRVGGESWTSVDVRVIAATRRDLDREVQDGRFRDDLFFRLAVTRIELPPLRHRRGDVPLLARHFWHELGGADDDLPAELVARLEAHTWPGNVRELRNAIARRLALGDLAGALPTRRSPSIPAAAEGTGAAQDLVEHVLALDLPLARARQQVVDEFEARYVERVLARHGGNVARAAAASGIKRRYFQILRARRAK